MVEQINNNHDLADINSVSTTSWLPSRYPDRACTIKEQQQQVQMVRAHRLKNLLTTSTYTQLFRVLLSFIECIVFIVVLSKRDIDLPREANCKTPLITISMFLFYLYYHLFVICYFVQLVILTNVISLNVYFILKCQVKLLVG
eukprot:UN02933